MLNRSVPSFFHGKPTSERPFCPDCQSPMILSHLEPDRLGFDLRTYACLMCGATESIVVAIFITCEHVAAMPSVARELPLEYPDPYDVIRHDILLCAQSFPP